MLEFCPFHLEVLELKNIFLKNRYSLSFIDNCLKIFLEKVFIKKIKPITVPRKDFFYSFALLLTKSENKFVRYFISSFILEKLIQLLKRILKFHTFSGLRTPFLKILCLMLFSLILLLAAMPDTLVKLIIFYWPTC